MDISEPPQGAADQARAEPQLTRAALFWNVIVIVGPFIGLLGAMAMLWGWSFGWVHLGLLTGMYLVSGFGVTIGYHRLFTHRSFETSRIVRILLAVFGSMAVQGPLFKWVAVHRRHHHHSDEADDPHSPHQHGHTVPGMLRGWWHAHVGWIFLPEGPDLHRYVTDLLADPTLRLMSSMFSVWALLGLLIPTVLGGVFTFSWTGALLGFIWGGLVRIFMVHHITWSINSVCHIWGSQPFRSHDQSRNNVLFGVLGLGEGWHNNHHAFPTSARHGLLWWQFDVSWWIIKLMAWLGLVWNVRVPAPAAMALKQQPTAH